MLICSLWREDYRELNTIVCVAGASVASGCLSGCGACGSTTEPSLLRFHQVHPRDVVKQTRRLPGGMECMTQPLID